MINWCLPLLRSPTLCWASGNCPRDRIMRLWWNKESGFAPWSGCIIVRNSQGVWSCNSISLTSPPFPGEEASTKSPAPPRITYNGYFLCSIDTRQFTKKLFLFFSEASQRKITQSEITWNPFGDMWLCRRTVERAYIISFSSPFSSLQIILKPKAGFELCFALSTKRTKSSSLSSMPFYRYILSLMLSSVRGTNKKQA